MVFKTGMLPIRQLRLIERKKKHWETFPLVRLVFIHVERGGVLHIEINSDRFLIGGNIDGYLENSYSSNSHIAVLG